MRGGRGYIVILRVAAHILGGEEGGEKEEI